MSKEFNISNLFFEAAKNYPNHIAIIHNNNKIDYKELAAQVKNTAQYLLSKGIRKGDRVLIFIPMSMDLYRVVLAIFSIGATAVFLDEWVSVKRMETCCKVAECKGFIGIFKARVIALFSSELRKIPIQLSSNFKTCNKQQLIETCYENDTALITFTTGSTGTPKAAKRTHGFLKAQFEALKVKINPQENDVDMPVLPIVLLINLGIGCTSVIADFKVSKPQSFKGKEIVNQIANHHVNRIVASPFFIKTLSQYVIQTGSKLPSVKNVFTGGAPVFPNEALIYKSAFPQTHFQIVYGSTEAEPISSIDGDELVKHNIHDEKGLCVGMPDRSATVRIIKIIDGNISVLNDKDWQELEVNKGEIGEIIVAGNHVLSAYFNNDDALKRNKIFVDQTCWHRTGDSAFMDNTGKLFLTGRCSSLIYLNNEIITPFIYEGVLQSFSEINIGTVLFINNRLTLVIELQDRTLKGVVDAKLKDAFLKYDEIKFLDIIPRDPRHHSKIEYEKLKTLV